MSEPHSSFDLIGHSSFRLVVGLGNPGRQYVGTRHNIGWEVIDLLAVKLGWTTSASDFDRLARQKFDALTLDGLFGSRRVMLLKPTTYMNLSGASVRQAMDFFQVAPENVMIVLDELALPCGRIRIRPDGSHGGHNGLRDIQRVLGNTQYPRLRLGVDAPPSRVPGRDYVLGKFSAEQRPVMDRAVNRAADAVACWTAEGVQAAMNKFNAPEGDTVKKQDTGGRPTGQNPS